MQYVHHMIAIAYNKKKYDNAVLYFINHCNNKYLGDTKLNKLLYYLDFVHFRDGGKSVMGDRYFHFDFGPVPYSVREVVSSLVAGGKITKEEVLLEEGGHKVTYEAQKKPTMSVFSKAEKELLENICKEFKRWPTKKMVAQTHLEAPWFYSSHGEKVSYAYAKDIDIL